MTTHMPILETNRLIIRPFESDDLESWQQIMVDAGWVDEDLTPKAALAERRVWLDWTIRNYDALGNLYQPPYGDRAITLKTTGQLIGGVGLVPSLTPLGLLPRYQAQGAYNMPEFGLFWALGKAHRGHGYATEAAQVIIDYAFQTLNIKRIIATTTYDNEASMAVMGRLEMTIEKNPRREPHWFQVVGILEHEDYLILQSLMNETQKANHLE